MLRAAYFGQELLSTFGAQIGEIALIPATGGLFTVDLVSTTFQTVEQF
jgi:predicted Rdx family selenoprotein